MTSRHVHLPDLVGRQVVLVADVLDAIEHLRRNSYEAMVEAVAEVASETRVNTPVKTGFLSHSTFEEPVIDRVGVYTSAIVNDAPYALFVDRGTMGGQLITPVNSVFLAWDGPDGHTRFARAVIRGATPAANFFSEPMPARFTAALENAYRVRT